MHGAIKHTREFSHLPYANPSAIKGGKFTQCAIGTFDTLNDNVMKGKPAQGLHLLNDPLMRRVWDEPFSVYGVIAQNISIPDDRSSITFYLNPNAIFHDGAPITTKDVDFSFKTLRDKGKPNTRNVYKLVEKTTITTDYEITFHFGKGFDRETALIIAMMPIYSKSYWETREFDATGLTPPLGNGPYKIKSVDAGKSITYEKVTDYWAKNNPVNIGHYNFDYMAFDYYRDGQVAVEAFKSQECDIRREFNPAKWQVNYDDQSEYMTEEIAHSRPEPTKGFIMNTRRAPFHDINVRRAMTLAFDFDWVNRTLLANTGKPITSTFSNSPLQGDFQFDNRDKRERLKDASRLLDTSGWPLKDGKRFEISLLLNNPQQEKIALGYARDLKRIGVILNIRTLDSAQFFGALNDYDYDMISWRWINSLSPGTEQSIYWGCGAANTQGSRNYSGLCDTNIDFKIKQLSNAKTYDDLTSHTKKLDRIVMDQYPFVPLYYTGMDYIARWPHIRHPDTQSTYGVVMETWWQENN